MRTGTTTVKATFALAARTPLVAMTLTVAEAAAAELLAVRRRLVVHEPEQLAGENDAVTPAGRLEAEKTGAAPPLAVALILTETEEP